MGRAGVAIKKDKATKDFEKDPRFEVRAAKEHTHPVTADNLAAPPHLSGTALAKWNELRGVLEPAGLLD